MVCSNNSIICFIAIFNSHALTKPIVEELIPSPIPSQRAGKGACDVTCRDPKSEFISNTIIFLNQINSIYHKTISFKQIFGKYHNGNPF